MTQIFKFLDGKYEIVNEASGTRNGFRHTAKLYKYGNCIGQASLGYLNRTWESYEFQSVMIRAVNLQIEKEIEGLLCKFMLKNDYKRMTEKRYTEFNSQIKDNKDIAELKMILKEL